MADKYDVMVRVHIDEHSVREREGEFMVEFL